MIFKNTTGIIFKTKGMVHATSLYLKSVIFQKCELRKNLKLSSLFYMDLTIARFDIKYRVVSSQFSFHNFFIR